MINLLAVIIFSVCIYAVLGSRSFRRLNRGWDGVDFFPRGQKMTMFDVRNLLIKGEKDMAVRVYSQLFKVGFEESLKAVNELERSIQHKDFEI
jgi:hypothetical protein